MKIIGAGMAGLIAGHMLRRHSPEIHEAASSLPNNHSALLRFRSDAVAKATLIPFKKVNVRKGVAGKSSPYPSFNATINDINAYSEKVSGIVSERSIADLSPCERWVAPPDFISELHKTLPCKVKFQSTMTPLTIATKDIEDVWVSTIPMPLMMKLVDWPIPKGGFTHKEITTISAKISHPVTEVYQTIYLPHRDWGNIYRVSIHCNDLIVEAVGNGIEITGNLSSASDSEICRFILSELFGIPSPVLMSIERKYQKFGKMVKIDDFERKSFIRFLTDKYNIYSLGRFATWRPILLDDIVSDVEVIEKLIRQTPYDRKKH